MGLRSECGVHLDLKSFDFFCEYLRWGFMVIIWELFDRERGVENEFGLSEFSWGVF